MKEYLYSFQEDFKFNHVHTLYTHGIEEQQWHVLLIKINNLPVGDLIILSACLTFLDQFLICVKIQAKMALRNRGKS